MYLSLYRCIGPTPIYSQNLVFIYIPEYCTCSNILPEPGIYLYTGVLYLLQYIPRTWYISLYRSIETAPIYYQNLVFISISEYWNCSNILPEPGIYLYTGELYLLQYTPGTWYLSLYQSLEPAPIYSQNLVFISIPESWTCSNILPEPGIYLYTGVLNLLQYTPRTWYLSLYRSLDSAPIYFQNMYLSLNRSIEPAPISSQNLVFIFILENCTCSNILQEPGIYLYTGVLNLLQYTPRTWYLSLYRSLEPTPIYSQNLVFISIPEYWTYSNILPEPGIYLYTGVLNLLQYTHRAWYLSLYRSIEPSPIYSQNLVFISIPEYWTYSNILPELGIYLYTGVLNLLQYTTRTWYLSI